jgi:hypothetical protein
LSIYDDKQGRAARADTRPLDLLAARSNRLGGLFLLALLSRLLQKKINK